MRCIASWLALLRHTLVKCRGCAMGRYRAFSFWRIAICFVSSGDHYGLRRLGAILALGVLSSGSAVGALVKRRPLRGAFTVRTFPALSGHDSKKRVFLTCSGHRESSRRLAKLVAYQQSRSFAFVSWRHLVSRGLDESGTRATMCRSLFACVPPNGSTMRLASASLTFDEARAELESEAQRAQLGSHLHITGVA